MGGVKNWSVGAQRGRETQSARAAENLEGAKRIFEFIVWKYRPTTRAQYAQRLNDEGCPTPSGRAKWSGSLVNQYMRRLGQTPKSLLAEFPERTGMDVAYRPEIYAAYRAEIMRLSEVHHRNGNWRSATEREPKVNGAIYHPKFGHGDFVGRVGLTKMLGTFTTRDANGSVHFIERECRPADLLVFEFYRSVEQRYADQIEFWKRLIKDEKMSLRLLIDGWYL